MRIAQISDTHIAVPPIGRADREADLTRVVDAIRALDPRPDLVVHTGDAANAGEIAEYERLAAIMNRLPAPWVIATGNRDSRRRLRESLSGLLPFPASDHANAPVDYAVDAGPVRLVVFDSTSAGTNKGRADATRRAALDALLAQTPRRPVVLAMHHPPFAVTDMRDPHQFADWAEAEALNALVARHPQVALIITGHTHRFGEGRVGGRPAFTMPSVAHDLRKGEARSLRTRPALLLHDFDAAGRWLGTRLHIAEEEPAR